MPTPREEIEEILVDAYGEYEQTAAWEVTFMEAAPVPFRAVLLGMTIEVVGFRISKADTLQCEVVRQGKQRWLEIEALDDDGLPAEMQHLLSLYRVWQNGEHEVA